MSDIQMIQFIMGVLLPIVFAWIFNHRLKKHNCHDGQCLRLYRGQLVKLQPGRMGGALETHH